MPALKTLCWQMHLCLGIQETICQAKINEQFLNSPHPKNWQREMRCGISRQFTISGKSKIRQCSLSKTYLLYDKYSTVEKECKQISLKFSYWSRKISLKIRVKNCDSLGGISKIIHWAIRKVATHAKINVWSHVWSQVWF